MSELRKLNEQEFIDAIEEMIENKEVKMEILRVFKCPCCSADIFIMGYSKEEKVIAIEVLEEKDDPRKNADEQNYQSEQE